MIVDIVLVSSTEALEILSIDKRFQGPHVLFYKVSGGSAPFEGARIRNAYIDWYCFEDEHYLECLERIDHSIKMTSPEGKMYLL